MAILGELVPRRRLAEKGMMILLLLTIGLWLPAAAQSLSREYQLKAVFLYNFAQFTEWPAGSFADSNAPVVIGVLGKDPFGPALDETVRGEMVNGRRLEVRRYRRAEEIKDCHVLFISASEASQLGTALAGFKTRPVLTVGETDAFVLNGGIIRFAVVDNKIRLRVNVDAARRASLTISSKLLRLADIVTAEKD